MRQILYVSLSTVPGDSTVVQKILEQSRHNNAIDGITGLLWSDERRFLQVFEGPRRSVGPIFERICADPRHRSMRILQDRTIEAREFGSWNMAHRRPNDPVDVYDRMMSHLLRNASVFVRQQFVSLIATG